MDAGRDGSAVRPLRADAARNAERIVRAARDAFAESGMDVPLEEVARRAGVGVATLYRRFPNKEELIRAIIEWRYAETVEPAIEAALADTDPWRGLVGVLEAAVTVAAAESGPIKAARDPAALTKAVLSRFLQALAAVVRRAQDQGLVRADLSPADLLPLVSMLMGALDVTAPDTQDWRRYLALLLDALRPSAAHPLPTATRPTGAHHRPHR